MRLPHQDVRQYRYIARLPHHRDPCIMAGAVIGLNITHRGAAPITGIMGTAGADKYINRSIQGHSITDGLFSLQPTQTLYTKEYLHFINYHSFLFNIFEEMKMTFMKKLFAATMAIIITCASFSIITAQEKQAARISSIKQKEDMVLLTVSSAKEFYMGNNKHILYIGSRYYDLYDQQNEDGKGNLKFFIPVKDFKQMTNGTPVYLSYGELVIEDGQNIEDMCKQNFCPCWSVGKLNKKMLK